MVLDGAPNLVLPCSQSLLAVVREDDGNDSLFSDAHGSFCRRTIVGFIYFLLSLKFFKNHLQENSVALWS